MKFDELVAHHTTGTSLDPIDVKGFLRTPPHYYLWGMSHQIDPIALKQLDATDLFEFYLRYYLIGRHKTLHAVLREVRAFAQQDPNGACHLIKFSLECTRQSLVTIEWYELMPRLEIAQKMILPLVSDRACPLRPFLVSFLEESY